MRREPSCRFFFTYFRLFDQAKNTTVDHKLWGPLPEREFQTLGLFYRNYISGISICINRQAWEGVGRFNERLRYAQDYDMWLRLLARHPATFIPEWTCINRHHSGQYSEIFPQACYYDTAAAGVQFLNDHRFEELFPLLDLRDPSTALLAVERALTQAADDSAFLYWYASAHPNLLARTLEWAWNRNLGAEVIAQRAAARQLARQMLGDTARQLRDTPLGWHWRRRPRPPPPCPMPISRSGRCRLSMSGSGSCTTWRAQGKTDFADLQRYFRMQYNLELPPAPPKSTRRSVVICDSLPTSESSMRSTELAQELLTAGCQVVVVSKGGNELRYKNGCPIINADSHAATNEVVRGLLPTDAVVWLQTAGNPDPFPSKRHYIMSNAAEKTTAIAERILDGRSSSRTRRMSRQVPASAARRKVVFIGRSPWGGGAERVTYDLLHGLDPHKYDLHFVHLFGNEGPQIDFDPVITVHNVEGAMAGPTNPGPLWKRMVRRAGRLAARIGQSLTSVSQPTAIAQHLEPFQVSLQQAWPHVVALRDILRQIGSDALLIPVMEEATVRVWLAQAFANQPYCASLHTTESYNLPLMYPDPDRLTIERFLFACACRNAAAITLPSQGCKHDLVQHFGVHDHLVKVIPNPIDMDSILQMSGEVPEAPLPAKHGKCVFVHAARLSLEKNHYLLLDACQLLKQRHVPDFMDAFVSRKCGDVLRSELQQRICDFGLQDHVFLLGAVKNPFAYMARAHGLVLTSQFESFALVLLEALACGATPIAVDCPYGPREVLDHGQHGLLVPNGDPQAIAHAMHRVATDRALREATRVRGPEHARAYDLTRIVSQWELLIDHLAIRTDSNIPSMSAAA